MKAIIPLFQHIGKAAHPIVKAGDLVKTGQLIADSEVRFGFGFGA